MRAQGKPKTTDGLNPLCERGQPPCFCQFRIQTQVKISPVFTFNLLRSSLSLSLIIQLESTKAHKLDNIWSFKDLGWNCLWNPCLNEEEEAAILDRFVPSQLIE